MASQTPIRPVLGRVLQLTCRHTTGIRTAPPASCLAAAGLAAPSTSSPAAAFSTTAALESRKPRRDNNRLRGLSAIYRSGTRGRAAVDGVPLPRPRAGYEPAAEVVVDPNHGLYEFFYEKDRALLPPEDEAKHGRAWTVEELRRKGWDDLHRLWWVCVKERNRIATATRERKRLDYRTGEEESIARMQTVGKTMKAIKHALTERYYVWEDARKLAETDPEVDLSNLTNPYAPGDYLEEEVTEQLEAAEPELIEPVEAVDPSTLPKTPEAPQEQPQPTTTRP